MKNTKAKTDCFAYRNGNCLALLNLECINGKCSFYKSHDDYYSQIERCADRLNELCKANKEKLAEEIKEVTATSPVEPYTYLNAVNEIGIRGIVMARDYIDSLANCVIEGSHVLGYKDQIKKPLNDFIEKMETHKKCPRCGSKLYQSDVGGYSYVCIDCNENFHTVEVK